VWNIGITLPLTGPAAQYGIAARNGFELARAHNPHVFARIRFHYQDTQLKPALAVEAFQALQRRQHPIAHFDFGSATSLALAPIAERKSVLLVSSAYDPAVSQGRQHVFRFANNTVDYAETILKTLRRRGIKRTTLVVSENPFFVQFAQTIESLLRADESVVIHSVRADESDFGSIALKLRHTTPGPEALGVFLFVEQATLLLRKLRTFDWEGFIFGTDALEEVSPTLLGVQLFDGIEFPNTSVQADFIDAYKDAFKTTAHYTFAAGTYDFAHLIADASMRCLRCDQAELQQELEDPTVRVGALGHYRFTSSPMTGRYFASKVVMKVLRNGEISVLE
jgi:ABC-type branched-subunit amino acid transport system substrate-binding protein